MIIGVYDSGMGGLTVLKEFQKSFPHARFVYVADTLNLPYGNKSPEQIRQYSHAIMSWMQDVMGVSMVVAACHTSSALALDHLAADFKIPLLGTIYPLVRYLQKKPAHKRIGIIATPASAKSQMHEKIFRQQGVVADMLTVACPEFVPLIEAHQGESRVMKQYAQTYLQPLLEFDMDTLLYGCTHYPLIKPLLESLVPPTVFHLDPAAHMAHAAQVVLNTVSSAPAPESRSQFFGTSPDTMLLRQKIATFLGHDPGAVPYLNIHSNQAVIQAAVLSA